MGEHCCESMIRQVTWHCDDHEDPFDCPDALVWFGSTFQEYGLIIHDGGTSAIGIAFCPWCGSRLPESQRDHWFEEPEQRGIDPQEDEIPAEYADGRRPHP
ncbi:DUF6980 family protein [Streptosporangium sandarakinum]|uniref:DUF6980 family protein n=1 Tax=Streptosporangium sandarakinum TaxID=1260955 RepID=UPI0037A18E01